MIRQKHVFERNEDDSIKIYQDLGFPPHDDYHSGPHCIVCDHYWCDKCDPKVYNETFCLGAIDSDDN